jgi:hypothetical protein
MLHTEELRILYSFPNIIKQIKSGECGWRGMWLGWEMREKCTRFQQEGFKERDHSEDRGVDGKRRDLKGDWLSVVLIKLAQDRDRWWALLNAMINHSFLEPRS